MHNSSLLYSLVFGHVALAQTWCGEVPSWPGQLHSLSRWVDCGGQGAVRAGVQFPRQEFPPHPADGKWECMRVQGREWGLQGEEEDRMARIICSAPICLLIQERGGFIACQRILQSNMESYTQVLKGLNRTYGPLLRIIHKLANILYMFFFLVAL